MLSSILQNTLKTNLEKKYPNRYSLDILEKFIKIISYFDKGGCITINQISDNLKITKADAMLLLAELTKLNYLKPVYKIYCPECNHTSKDFYEMKELSEFLICEECEHPIVDEKNLLKYLTLLFQVIE